MNKLSDEYSNNVEGIVDLRDKSNHPITLKYSEIFNVCLLNVKVENGRVLPFYKLDVSAPFYKAALEGLKHNTKDSSYEAIKSSLFNFYSRFQPENIADWFSLNNTNNLEILSLPPWAGILPWRARSLESFKDIIEQGTIKDNYSNGVIGGIENGWAYCGPVSDDKLNIETKRINDLIYSIREKGYLRTFDKDGDIIASALVDKEHNWKWLVTNGYHRACVLAAMGFSTLAIRINLVILENEVEFWPHVLDGFYTKEEASKIFIDIFNAK